MDLSILNFSKRNLLSPLNELNDNDRKLVFEKGHLKGVEPRSLVTPDENVLIYLLEGEVSLLSAGFVSESFTHNDSRALKPLFNEALEEDSVLFTSHGILFEVDKAFFEGLYLQSQAAQIEQNETELSQSEDLIFQHIYEVFQNKKLELPMLPEAALKIRKAVNTQQDISSQEIIDIVQTDAALSARLLKVANSPLYGTWREIKTIKDAVRRLGVEVTRNLSFSLSVHQLYDAKTRLIKTEMKKLYALTRRISSLSYTLIKEFCDDLDPEHAILAGLLQGVGILPILKYIDNNPHLAQSDAQLNKSIHNLIVPISVLLFNDWHLSSEYIDYIEQSENWLRNSDEPVDYLDVLIVARLLYLHEQGGEDLPDLNTIPLIHKMGILDHYDSVDDYLNHIKEDLTSIDSLLS